MLELDLEKWGGGHSGWGRRGGQRHSSVNSDTGVPRMASGLGAGVQPGASELCGELVLMGAGAGDQGAEVVMSP